MLKGALVVLVAAQRGLLVATLPSAVILGDVMDAMSYIGETTMSMQSVIVIQARDSHVEGNPPRSRDLWSIQEASK